MIRQIRLGQIEMDSRLQSRQYGVNGTVASEYEELMRAGTEFPPIIVFTEDGDKFFVGDGWHRIAASRRLSRETIKADVRDGGLRQAELYAMTEANRDHGLQLTRDDKRKRVMHLLSDPEWARMSDRQIAKLTGTSHPFVGILREQASRQSGNVTTPVPNDDWRASVPAFIKSGRVVAKPIFNGSYVLALVDGEATKSGPSISVPITYKGDVGYLETLCDISLLVDPLGMRVRIPSGIVGTIQNVREDRLSVTYPNGDGGNQTNTLDWRNCTLTTDEVTTPAQSGNVTTTESVQAAKSFRDLSPEEQTVWRMKNALRSLIAHHPKWAGLPPTADAPFSFQGMSDTLDSLIAAGFVEHELIEHVDHYEHRVRINAAGCAFIGAALPDTAQEPVAQHNDDIAIDTFERIWDAINEIDSALKIIAPDDDSPVGLLKLHVQQMRGIMEALPV